MPAKKRAIYRCICLLAKIVNSQQRENGKAIKHPVILRPNLSAIMPTVMLITVADMHVIPVNQDASSSVIGSLPTGGFSLCNCGIVGDCQPTIVPNEKAEMFARKESR